MKLISIKIWSYWHCNKSRCSMISKEEKYFWIRVWFKDRSSCFGFISLKNCKKSISGGFWSAIVNFTSFINILAWSSSWAWFIENLSWEWIVWRISNVVISQMNDLIFRYTILLENLISMASICLMSVVSIRIRACNKNSPMVWSSCLSSGCQRR